MGYYKGGARISGTMDSLACVASGGAWGQGPQRRTRGELRLDGAWIGHAEVGAIVSSAGHVLGGRVTWDPGRNTWPGERQMEELDIVAFKNYFLFIFLVKYKTLILEDFLFFLFIFSSNSTLLRFLKVLFFSQLNRAWCFQHGKNKCAYLVGYQIIMSIILKKKLCEL